MSEANLNTALKFFTFLFCCHAFLVFASDDLDRQIIEQRIAPIGQVHMDSYEASIVKTTPAPALKMSKGQSIYEKYCVVCHQNGLAGAPKFRHADDWKSRMTGKTINDLVVIAAQGLNAMPMKGTCAECTDSDLKAAVEYMVPQ